MVDLFFGRRSVPLSAACALSLAVACDTGEFKQVDDSDESPVGGGSTDPNTPGGPTGLPDPGTPPETGEDAGAEDGGADAGAGADAGPTNGKFVVSATKFGAQAAVGTVSTTGAWAAANLENDYVAFRFPLAVPAGATVTGAQLSVVLDPGSNSPDLYIYAEPTPDSPAVKTTDFNISARGSTASVVRWKRLDLGGGRHAAPSLTKVVSEVVASKSWKSGSSILVIARTPATSKCWIATPEQADANRPKLTVSYTLP